VTDPTLLDRLDRIVHSDAPYGTVLRDVARDAAAEVRALSARLAAARAAYLGGDWDGLEVALDVSDFPKDGPTVAVDDLRRAATANSTPPPEDRQP
jgi:hypothetical protein